MFIAHNAKGFDSYLFLNKMTELGLKPSKIMQGSKVLCLGDLDFGLKFIDSLSFLTTRLSVMPKALGFTDRSKGYFPHLFSSEECLSNIGPYPDPRYYGVERMTSVEQEAFFIWYRDAAHSNFNFEEEARHYCKNDVDILLEGCGKFRRQFIDETGVDPFSCITPRSGV